MKLSIRFYQDIVKCRVRRCNVRRAWPPVYNCLGPQGSQGAEVRADETAEERRDVDTAAGRGYLNIVIRPSRV